MSSPQPDPRHRSQETDGETSIASPRADGRGRGDLRPVEIHRGWSDAPEGSVLIETGRTRVLCTATFSASVPRWRRGSGQGWVAAEYAMLPRSTAERSDRESVRGRPRGRTQEISRLIGRALRGVVNVGALGENSIQLDCDVLQADGGTRTAAITGAYVAMYDAVAWAKAQGRVPRGARVIVDSVSAVSVGILDGRPVLDLPYEEDVRAETDMSVVQTGSGTFVEIQGTAERGPFDRSQLGELLDLAAAGNAALREAQQRVLAQPLAPRQPL